MMDFTGVVSITIPEGSVAKIMRGSEVLWEKPEMVDVAIRAVTDGDKSGSTIILVTKAPKGANKNAWLDANVTIPEKPGYTIDKWYNWDWYGHKFGASDTFNGYSNTYVTYTSITGG